MNAAPPVLREPNGSVLLGFMIDLRRLSAVEIGSVSSARSESAFTQKKVLGADRYVGISIIFVHARQRQLQTEKGILDDLLAKGLLT